ncbi:MAE_28990/MAE_18760 family HEPN-like nuclease [Herbaspirillum seropedicae]|uniref:MAE_28990/MAE_18760 family HEPN-like nuclease n=1 Tax=Herbaspirillum seropedicae TaxID=964 RepID=UPI003FCC407E
MSKPYLDSDFSQQIVEDRTWRMREIADLKSAIKRGDAQLQKVLLRALVAICYAHWEGYVKFSARKYMEFVSLRRFPYSELNKQFFKNLFLPHLAALSSSKTSVSDRCDLIEEILTRSNQRYSQVNEDLINTKSNLNFEVFKDICLVCNLPADAFNDHGTFIDVSLLKRRNSIAHGEDTLIGLGELDTIVNTSIDLMRMFGDLLENQVVLKSYKSA